MALGVLFRRRGGQGWHLEAHQRFGRGSGHPATLNFGDCITYTLAKDLGEALVYKGDDFGHTDLQRAP